MYQNASACLGGNRYTNYPLAEMFLQKGYNVLTYDQRSSNENTAQYTTFGYWEKYDLFDYIDYVYRYAPEQVIGIWGTSFGGATAGLAMGDKDVCTYQWTIKNASELGIDKNRIVIGGDSAGRYFYMECKIIKNDVECVSE